VWRVCHITRGSGLAHPRGSLKQPGTHVPTAGCLNCDTSDRCDIWRDLVKTLILAGTGWMVGIWAGMVLRIAVMCTLAGVPPCGCTCFGLHSPHHCWSYPRTLDMHHLLSCDRPSWVAAVRLYVGGVGPWHCLEGQLAPVVVFCRV
jgi:hypothetical protein